MVELNVNLFAATVTTVIAKDMEYHLEWFNDNGELELIPAHDPANGRIKEVKTQNLMYILAALLHQLLGQELNAKDALTLLVPLIGDLGRPELGVYRANCAHRNSLSN